MVLNWPELAKIRVRGKPRHKSWGASRCLLSMAAAVAMVREILNWRACQTTLKSVDVVSRPRYCSRLDGEAQVFMRLPFQL